MVMHARVRVALRLSRLGTFVYANLQNVVGQTVALYNQEIIIILYIILLYSGVSVYFLC